MYLFKKKVLVIQIKEINIFVFIDFYVYYPIIHVLLRIRNDSIW